MSMKAQGKDVARISELTASLVAAPTKGSVSAAITLRTPEPALAGVAVIGVIAVIGVTAVMLTWGPRRQQSAELALTDDDDSPERLEPQA